MKEAGGQRQGWWLEKRDLRLVNELERSRDHVSVTTSLSSSGYYPHDATSCLIVSLFFSLPEICGERLLLLLAVICSLSFLFSLIIDEILWSFYSSFWPSRFGHTYDRIQLSASPPLGTRTGLPDVQFRLGKLATRSRPFSLMRNSCSSVQAAFLLSLLTVERAGCSC